MFRHPRVAEPSGRSALRPHADVAQLVEHHLAKVRVAGSNPVVRSERPMRVSLHGSHRCFLAECPSGLGKGLQIPAHGFDSRLRLVGLVPRRGRGRLAQLVRALPRHGRGHRFESCIAHQHHRGPELRLWPFACPGCQGGPRARPTTHRTPRRPAAVRDPPTPPAHPRAPSVLRPGVRCLRRSATPGAWWTTRSPGAGPGTPDAATAVAGVGWAGRTGASVRWPPGPASRRSGVPPGVRSGADGGAGPGPRPG